MLYLFLMISVLAIAMAWVIASSVRGKPLLKVGFITILLYIGLCLILSFEMVKGWPTTQSMPEQFVLVSTLVQEPDKRTNSDGAIYLWIVPKIISDSCPPGVVCVKQKDPYAPRAYKLPYSKEDHEQILQIQKKIEQGDTIIVENPEDEKRRRGDDDSQFQRLEFYDMPDFLDELRK